MAVTIGQLAKLCARGGLPHHLDDEQGLIRVVIATRDYVNARSERIAIIRLETADDGTRCRAVLERAFATTRRPAATCLAVCEAIGAVPFVRIEHDAASGSLRLVAEMPVEDARVSLRQIGALLDSVIEAAETAQRAFVHDDRSGSASDVAA